MSDRLFFGEFGVVFTFRRGGNTEIVYTTRWISISIKQQLECVSQKRFDLCETAALQKGKCEVEGGLLCYTLVHFGSKPAGRTVPLICKREIHWKKQIKVTPFKGLCSSPSMCPHSPPPFILKHLPRMILHLKKIFQVQELWCDVSHMNGLKSFVSSTKETDGILYS